MKKLLLLFAILVSGLAQAQLPPELHGTWVNGTGRVLKIHVDDHYNAWDSEGNPLYSGRIEIVGEGVMHVVRDNGDEMDLAYYVGHETFIVTVPGSDGAHAWIFRKAGG